MWLEIVGLLSQWAGNAFGVLSCNVITPCDESHMLWKSYSQALVTCTTKHLSSSDDLEHCSGYFGSLRSYVKTSRLFPFFRVSRSRTTCPTLFYHLHLLAVDGLELDIAARLVSASFSMSDGHEGARTR